MRLLPHLTPLDPTHTTSHHNTVLLAAQPGNTNPHLASQYTFLENPLHGKNPAHRPRIACTNPRRAAATSAAQHVASNNLESSPSTWMIGGLQCLIRWQDERQDQYGLLTDSLLLRTIQGDRIFKEKHMWTRRRSALSTQTASSRSSDRSVRKGKISRQ